MYFLETLQLRAPWHGGVLYSFWYWWNVVWILQKNIEKCPFTYWLNGRWFLKIVDRDSGNLYPIYILYSLVLIYFFISNVEVVWGGGVLFFLHFMLFPTFLEKNSAIKKNVLIPARTRVGRRHIASYPWTIESLVTDQIWCTEGHLKSIFCIYVYVNICLRCVCLFGIHCYFILLFSSLLPYWCQNPIFTYVYAEPIKTFWIWIWI